MTKSDLVVKVQEILGAETTSKVAAESAVKAVLEGIVAGAIKDNLVQLPGFGTFKVVQRKARKGINPFTKKPQSFPAKKVLTFKVGSTLKTLVANPKSAKPAKAAGKPAAKSAAKPAPKGKKK